MDHINDLKVDYMVAGFEDELEKVGFKIPGLGNILRKGLQKAPLVGVIGAAATGTGALGYQAGEEAGEAKIPAAFSVGVEIGAQAQAEHDASVIQQLQGQLASMSAQGQ